MGALRAVWVAAGLLLAFAVLGDVVGTLVITNADQASWRVSRRYYRVTWRMFRWLAHRSGSPERRNGVLGAYGPLSLLGLLALWLSVLLVGWAAVFYGLRTQVDGLRDFGDALYFSGTALFTIGFGDITPVSGLSRAFTLVEAATGLGTVALVIGYLPTLYAAYSDREAQLLTLDDPSGERIQPTALIALYTDDGDTTRLYRLFREWELWTARVLESHVSYPMLATFRSKFPGQSWVSALGVVLDAATIVCAAVPGADRREAYFMYRRGVRALDEIGRRIGLPELPADAGLRRDLFDVAYARMRDEIGLPVGDPEEIWPRLCDLREAFFPRLEQLITSLEAPRGFWGHSAQLSS